MKEPLHPLPILFVSSLQSFGRLGFQSLDSLGVLGLSIGILMRHLGRKVDGIGTKAMQRLPGNPVHLEVAHGCPGPGIADGDRILDQERGNQDLLVTLVLVPDLNVNRMGEVMDSRFPGDGKTF